jgi:hypothetical protein
MAGVKLSAIHGTDTESTFVLAIDTIPVVHNLITRARLVLTGSTLALDSGIYPAAWDFTNAAKLTVKLGRGDLVPGRYRGRLVTHDANHSNGLAWDTDLELTIL